LIDPREIFHHPEKKVKSIISPPSAYFKYTMEGELEQIKQEKWHFMLVQRINKK
jgi:hypothetical protein